MKQGISFSYLFSVPEELNYITDKENLEGVLGIMSQAIMCYGAIIFVPTSAFGRRNPILTADYIIGSGTFIGAMAFNMWMLILARAVVGVGLGVMLFASPMYIAEVSPHKIRGAFISTFFLFVSGGQLLAYPILQIFSKVPGTWRWMLLLGGAISMLQINLMKCLPESPKKLFRQVKVGSFVDVSRSHQISCNGGDSYLNIFPLIGLYLYIIFHSLGFGIVPWIINLEIHPYSYRESSLVLVGFLSQVSNLIGSTFLSIISVSLGVSNTLSMYCVLCLAVGLFVFLFIPETNGMRIEEVEKMMKKI